MAWRGVQIDKNVDFEEHITSLLKEGNQELYALMHISKYLTRDKIMLIMKTFIESQFNYCPLLWMCHSRELNRKINRLHERTLKVIYKIIDHGLLKNTDAPNNEGDEISNAGNFRSIFSICRDDGEISKVLKTYHFLVY